MALALYPLNAEALLAAATVRLSRQDIDASLEQMETQVRAALPSSAGDARIYSLLGEVLRRRGQTQAGQAAFVGSPLNRSGTDSGCPAGRPG